MAILMRATSAMVSRSSVVCSFSGTWMFSATVIELNSAPS